jgi:hypothetical protein
MQDKEKPMAVRTANIVAARGMCSILLLAQAPAGFDVVAYVFWAKKLTA